MAARQESCCFTGHRPNKLPWRFEETDPRCVQLKKRMADAVEAAYQEGYRRFICGMAMGCDFYFFDVTEALRQRYPEITIEAAIPCLDQAEDWPEEQQLRYRRMLAACDQETLVSEEHTPGCMTQRDRYMVDHSSLVIAAFDGTPGGTQYTVQYAMKKQVTLVDLPILVESTEKTQTYYKYFTIS